MARRNLAKPRSRSSEKRVFPRLDRCGSQLTHFDYPGFQSLVSRHSLCESNFPKQDSHPVCLFVYLTLYVYFACWLANNLTRKCDCENCDFCRSDPACNHVTLRFTLPKTLTPPPAFFHENIIPPHSPTLTQVSLHVTHLHGEDTALNYKLLEIWQLP